MTADNRPFALELRAISKRYRRQTVLEKLDLCVSPGEIVGLLGPNGSGKTTTLRIAAGYLWPDSGRVYANGTLLTPDNPNSRAQVGYLPERVPLYDPFRVERYLAFVASARGLRGAERAAAVDDVLAGFDLLNVRRRIIGQLSKGYRQRIGLAQALLGNPDVLLLDEPTNGLDPFQIIEARELIRSAARDRAVIFSTHIMQEVEALCTRVVYLADGALIDLQPASNADLVSPMLAELRCEDLEAVLAVLVNFDPRLEIADVAELGPGRYRLRIATAADRRAELARTLTRVGELQAFFPGSATLEDRLVDVIRLSANKVLP